jgi:hypothetical protein
MVAEWTPSNPTPPPLKGTLNGVLRWMSESMVPTAANNSRTSWSFNQIADRLPSSRITTFTLYLLGRIPETP